MAWAKAELKRNGEKESDGPALKKCLEANDLFNCIRFPCMDMADIAGKLAASNFFDQSQLLALFTYIGASNDNKPKTKFNTKPREGGGGFGKSNILDMKQQKQLMKIWDPKKSSRWTRVYSGKTDGMNGSSWHAKVDQYTGSLSVMKDTSGNIFGGYTSNSWAGSYGYRTDAQGFLFGLKNSRNKPLKLVSTSDSYTLSCNSSNGPTWGSGHCLHITSQFNTNSNYCNYAASFRPSTESASEGWTYDSSNGSTCMSSAYNFTLADMETYVLKKSS